jgi:transcriptional regulator with XRE-family HTH domain
MDLKRVFIQNLKKYRKTRGFSQMKLAELCDSSTSYIGQIEIGNKFPSIEMIEKIAKALRVKPHLLFFDEFDPEGMDEPAPQKVYLMPETVKDDLLRQLTASIQRIIRKH